MAKRHLLLSAAVMALMIGGASAASAQYYRDYKPNDKPAVEVDMGVLDGSAEPQRNTYAPPPVEMQPMPAPAPLQPIAPLPRVAAPAPAPTRVLKPSGPPPRMEEPEIAAQEEAPAPVPVSKPYRPYLTTPVAKPAPAPQVAEAVEETPAPQPVRSYPPAPTPKNIEWEAPAPAPKVAREPVRSYPEPVAPKIAEQASPEPVAPPAPLPEIAQEEPPAPLPQPTPKPVVAKKYEPSPSVVDDASYKPDYSGYYKSGAPVPRAIANLEPKQPPKPQPKPAQSEPVATIREEEIAAAPQPEKAVAEQLTEELAPPPPLEQTAAAPSKHAADELSEQLPPAKLDPLPEIAAERSIEQTPPPAKPMAPIVSEPKQPVRMAAVDDRKIVSRPAPKSEYRPQPAPAPASTSKIVSMPVERTTPSPAPASAPDRTPAKIISYPDSTVVARPTGQSSPVMVPEPDFIPAVTPAETPEEKIVSMPEPQRKPAPAPAPDPVIAATPAPRPEPQPAPVVAAAPAKRPSLEILNTPAPEKPVQKIDGETAEAIVPPSKEENKTDIAQLAAEVDQAAAEMATAPAAPALDEPPKFASVPTHSDLTLEFPGNSSDLTAATQRKLDAIVRQMEDLVDGGRLQVRGYAAGEDGSKSSARRIALSRALSVRSYLMDKGVKAKRVDVRAMGSETDRNPLDRVDLIFQR